MTRTRQTLLVGTLFHVLFRSKLTNFVSFVIKMEDFFVAFELAKNTINKKKSAPNNLNVHVYWTGSINYGTSIQEKIMQLFRKMCTNGKIFYI